ncbi:MAG: hypothetical protein QXV37_01445 [Candidatus Jordarchaeaceae archaeon]
MESMQIPARHGNRNCEKQKIQKNSKYVECGLKTMLSSFVFRRVAKNLTGLKENFYGSLVRECKWCRFFI